MSEQVAPPRLVIYFAIFAYVDLLFLPYFQFLIMPISLPFAVVGILLMRGVMLPLGSKTILGLLGLLMLLSVAVGLFVPQSSAFAAENAKRLIQVWSGFVYFAFFYTVARHYSIEYSLRLISFIFLGYFAFWLAWFLVDPLVVNGIMRQLYGRLVTEGEIVSTHGRFAYLFTDPNTAGYFFVVAVLPWLPLYKSAAAKAAVFSACMGVALLLQSRGVMMAVVLAIIFWAILHRRGLLGVAGEGRFQVFKVLLISSMAVIGGSVFVLDYSGGDLVLRTLDRVFDVEAVREGGGRFDIWKRYVTELLPLPLGRGHVFEVAGVRFSPHSDLLRLIYSYGLIAAGLFVLWMVWSGWRYPLLTVPALMAFGVNTLIDEQKLFGLVLALVGVFSGMYVRTAYANDARCQDRRGGAEC